MCQVDFECEKIIARAGIWTRDNLVTSRDTNDCANRVRRLRKKVRRCYLKLFFIAHDLRRCAADTANVRQQFQWFRHPSLKVLIQLGPGQEPAKRIEDQSAHDELTESCLFLALLYAPVPCGSFAEERRCRYVAATSSSTSTAAIPTREYLCWIF